MATNEVIVPLNSLRPRDRLDRPLRDLRISVMDRCNFRCPYCMPREQFHESYRFLKSSQRLSFEEILRLARLFVAQGVRKIRLTGGEPLLRANLADLVGDLTSIAGVVDVALTTNGILLQRHAAELKAAGLSRITVSLDSLDPDVFARMSGGFGGVNEVLAGIEAAKRADLTPIKINAVVQRGANDHTVLDLVEHFRGSGVIVRFIEYMDVGNRNHWEAERVVPSKELVTLINARWPIQPLESNYRGEVARRYRFADGAGEVGFIRRSPSHSVASVRGRGCPRTAVFTRAYSRRRVPACEILCVPAPRMMNWRSSSATSGPAARTVTASCAPNCVRPAAITPRLRCTTSAVEYGIRTYTSDCPQPTHDGGCGQ